MLIKQRPLNLILLKHTLLNSFWSNAKKKMVRWQTAQVVYPETNILRCIYTSDRVLRAKAARTNSGARATNLDVNIMKKLW